MKAPAPAVTQVLIPAPDAEGQPCLLFDPPHGVDRFRGIAQTFEKPALQGGFDYSHSSGIYLGNWNSNSNEGAGFPSANLEMDFYGGWKRAFGDFGLDVGAIYYMYPGSDVNAGNGTGPLVNPRDATKTHTGKVDNKEFYIGGSWKWQA